MFDFNDVDYKLSFIEHQSYLFQNEYFSQELLSIEENQDRKVSSILDFISIDLLTFFSDEFDVYNLIVNTSKLKKLKQLL
jgi:hypothetical protein